MEIKDYKIVENAIEAPENVYHAIEAWYRYEMANDTHFYFPLNADAEDYLDDDDAEWHKTIKDWLYSIGIKRNDSVLLYWSW